MATTKIRYVGLKERETAFESITGVTWNAGEVQDIDTKHVEAMLKHPDVFALADADVAADGPANSVGTTADNDKIADPGTDTQWATAPDGEYLLLSDMSKEQLHECAKKYGVAVHPKCGAPKVIEALQAAFAVKE